MRHKIYFPIVAMMIAGFLYTGCTKSNDAPADSGVTASGVTSNDVAVVQDGESQDAVSDKVDQDVDTKADAVESNYFITSNLKSATYGYSIAIDKPATDTSSVVSTGFPKNITITYNTSDTINGEHIKLTGNVVIKVDTIPVGKKLYWRSHLKRTVTFNNLSISTDSSSFTINGTRSVTRLVAKLRLPELKVLRAEIKDSISSDLSLAATYNNITRTLTRKATKIRTSILHYTRATNTNVKWTANIKSDTIRYTGIITGTTGKGISYSRQITSPIYITFYQLWPYNPIISAGTITYTVGDKTPFTITYSADGAKTKATIARDGVTKIIERKLGRKFSAWW